MLKFSKVFSGREPCFDNVRAFIRHGVGNQFHFCDKPRLLHSPITLVKPSHLLAIEASQGKGIIAKVHLFATNGDESPFHLIRLGPYPFKEATPNPVCAHRFQIDSGIRDSGTVFDLKDQQVSCISALKMLTGGLWRKIKWKSKIL
jgi:hypothetical protein